MNNGAKSIRFDWERQLLKRGPSKATTRHVLLALATFVNKENFAWPTTLQLSEATALCERAVCTHLQFAVNKGWVERMTSRGQGKAWKNNTYKIVIPPLGAEPRSVPSGQGAEQRSVASHPLGTETGADATEAGDRMALKDVQSNNVANTSYNNPCCNGNTDFEKGNAEHSKIAEQKAQELGITRQPNEAEGAFQLRVMDAMLKGTLAKKSMP